MKRAILAIEGMSCASCVATVEKALQATEGVAAAQVNFATEKAAVDYDPGKTTLDALAKAVRGSGYDVRVEQADLPIAGMTCASCVAAVENSLRGVDGVLSASVNFATERASVTYLPDMTAVAELRRAVADAGYEALELDEEAPLDREREARSRELRELRNHLAISAGLALVIMVLSLKGFIPGLRELPDQPVFYALFVLATPVQFWIGWRFYDRAWAALRHGDGQHGHAGRGGHVGGLPLQRGGHLPPGALRRAGAPGPRLLRHFGRDHHADPPGALPGGAGQGGDQRGDPPAHRAAGQDRPR